MRLLIYLDKKYKRENFIVNFSFLEANILFEFKSTETTKKN